MSEIQKPATHEPTSEMKGHAGTAAAAGAAANRGYGFDPNAPHAPYDAILAQQQRSADAMKKAQAAQNPYDEAEEGYTSPEVVAASRSARGFRRGGVFVGPEKSTIPAGAFKNRAAFEAFMNDKQIVAVESPGAGLKKGAAAVGSGEATPIVRSLAGHAGSGENATPEMIEAAKEGTLLAHPSLGAPGSGSGIATSNSTPEGVRELEKEAQRQGAGRQSAAKKSGGAEGSVPAGGEGPNSDAPKGSDK